MIVGYCMVRKSQDLAEALAEDLQREGWFTLTQAAKYLGAHPNTLKNWEKRGVLKPTYIMPIRGDRRYSIDDLNKFRLKHHARLEK